MTKRMAEQLLSKLIKFAMWGLMIVACAGSVSTLSSYSLSAQPAAEYKVTVETVRVKMRDGVELAADIYRPQKPRRGQTRQSGP